MASLRKIDEIYNIFYFKMIAAYNFSYERKIFLYNLLSVLALDRNINNTVAPGFKIFIEPHKHNLFFCKPKTGTKSPRFLGRPKRLATEIIHHWLYDNRFVHDVQYD
jgi:hypothetical protein